MSFDAEYEEREQDWPVITDWSLPPEELPPEELVRRIAEGLSVPPRPERVPRNYLARESQLETIIGNWGSRLGYRLGWHDDPSQIDPERRSCICLRRFLGAGRVGSGEVREWRAIRDRTHMTTEQN
jgi:hypothetical protein